jgi:hypothetical protein
MCAMFKNSLCRHIQGTSWWVAGRSALAQKPTSSGGHAGEAQWGRCGAHVCAGGFEKWLLVVKTKSNCVHANAGLQRDDNGRMINKIGKWCPHTCWCR